MLTDRILKTVFKAVCAALLACAAPAQEPLDVLLDRGHVAHWLVCGPFRPDVEDGIAAALRRGEAPVGERDFMTPVGGIAAARPRHLLTVQAPEGDAIWQRAGAEGPALDLAPFFPGETEGVSYAAFYAESAREEQVYVNLHSPLGVRVWMNGVRLRDIREAPLSAHGVDRFIAAFRPGLNLIVIQVPGATLDAIAGAAGHSGRELVGRVFRNRTLLSGASGFEIGLTLDPAAMLGTLAYVPRLRPAGTFSGTPENLRQDALLTFFNPAGVNSPAVRAGVSAGGGEPAWRDVPPLTPGEERRERVAVPIGRRAPGDIVNVTVTLEAAGESARFTSPVTVREPEGAGRTYVLTGLSAGAGGDPESRVAGFRRHAALLVQEPAYGFVLGYGEDWFPALCVYPELRDTLASASALGRTGAWAAHGPLDERFVSGESIVRNLAYGVLGADTAFGAPPGVFLAWDAPALAPQTPQLLARAGVAGMLSDLDNGGIHALACQEAPDGTRLPHRRKEPAPPPASAADLREMTTVQRRELDVRGVASDLLPVAAHTVSPEPWYGGAAAELAQTFPPVYLRGGGAQSFFEELAAMPALVTGTLPVSARLLTAGAPGSLVARPRLTRLHALLENRLLAAETAAAFASLLGARYPAEAVDHAWRLLLHRAAPGRIGAVTHAQDVIEALSAYREVAAAADQVARRALEYLAGEADTLGGAPPDLEGVRPLFVFNPTARPRTDVCDFRLAYDTRHPLAIEDGEGRTIGHWAGDHRDLGGGRMNARLRFVAKDVPAMGYRVFHVTPRGTVAPPSRREDLQIENDHFLLIADPATGAIRSLVAKESGTEHAAGLLNHLALIEEDPARTDGGRDVWSSGDVLHGTSRPTEVRTTVAGGVQELVITTPFGGGTVTRRITLYEGVPRIDCETTLEGISLDGRLFAVTFQPPAAGRVPVYGERFGAVIGRRGAQAFRYRTAGVENRSGCALQPALRWFAASPGDHIQVGLDGVVPLAPAAVVYGEGAVLEGAARAVQSALIARGIPAGMEPDTPPARDIVWSDATTFESLDDGLAQGDAMRIVVGGPAENAYTRKLFGALPDERRAEVEERFKQAAAVYLLDTDIPAGFPPVPVLMLGGGTPEQAGEAARDFAEAIRERGVYALPPAACLANASPARPEDGLALFFEGPGLCGMEPDGTLVLALAHGAPLDVEPLAAPLSDALTFRYAIVPFSGDWRQAAVPHRALAYNRPLMLVETELHSGRQSASTAFLELSDADFVVTAVRPAGYVEAMFGSEPASARDGLAVRGYEATGRSWEGSLRCFMPFRRAARASLFEEMREPLETAGQLAVADVKPFQVETFWLLPSSQFVHGAPDPLHAEESPLPVEGRYWKHRTGAAPPGARDFSLVIRGTLGGEGPVEVAVANHKADAAVEGVVYLTLPEGWSASPPHFYYGLSAGESHVERITVVPGPGEPGTGGMAGWTERDGRTWRSALLEEGARAELEVARTQNQVRVTVVNRAGIPAEGRAEIVTDPSIWPELDTDAPVTVSPRFAAVRVAPFARQDLVFRVPEAVPAVVKLAANGQVVYAAVP